MKNDTHEDLMAQLTNMGACSEALEWVAKQEGADLQEMWTRCERADWMLWYAHRADVERRVLLHCAADCAESVLHLAAYRDVCARAISATRAVAENDTPETRKEAAATAAAAYAYSHAANAYSYADAYAAYVAADAAYAAAYAVYANSFGYATDAAYRARIRKMNADKIRERITV